MWKQRTEELWKRGWSKAIWENEGTKDHLRVTEGAPQRSGQGAPQGRGKSQCRLSVMGRSLICFCTERSPVKPSVARASERKKPGRLWVCKDKKDLCFPWQNKIMEIHCPNKWVCKITHFTFPESMFSKLYPGKICLSLTNWLFCRMNHNNAKRLVKSHHHWLVPPMPLIGFHNLMSSTVTPVHSVFKET